MNLYEPTTAILFTLGLLGLVIGSFINVVIQRFPKILQARFEEECREFLSLPPLKKSEIFNIAIPRSHCPRCKHRLAWQDLVPVLSYCFLGGCCRYCKAKISWQYPVVEILSAAILILIAHEGGINTYSILLMLLSEALLALAFIDLNTQLLPDDFTLSLLWVGLLFSLISPIITASSAILGAAVGYLAPWFIAKLYKLVRHKEGMGHGDFKLFALFGAWLGMQALPALFLVAVILGLIFSVIALVFKKINFNQSFPFGPAIIIAGWALLVWTDLILVVNTWIVLR